MYWGMPMSGSWRRKCKRSCRRRSCAGGDGYLKVFYDKLGLKFQTYNRWIAIGRTDPNHHMDRALTVWMSKLR